MKDYDKNKQVDTVILDFSKAFDTVPHRVLLHKLGHYGVRGQAQKWIAAFLHNRKQQVMVNGAVSAVADVASGVPQGTVLGPLLFLCIINDLPSHVTSSVRLFADDCLLYRVIRSIADHIALQKDLDSLQKWAKTWGMKFNASKCYTLRVTRSKKPSQHFYQLMGLVLQEVEHNPYLGVMLQHNMKWSVHINRISGRANSTLAFLRRNLSRCPKQLKVTAYKSLVRAGLDYASVIWDPHTEKEIKQLETVQRRAARFVCSDYRRDSSVTNMLSELQWESLQQRRRTARLVLFHKVVGGEVQVPHSHILQTNTNRTRAGARGLYQNIAASTETYRQSFFPKTLKEWNLLPKEYTDATDIASFKQSIIALQH